MNKKPELDFEKSRLEQASDVLALLGIAAFLVLILLYWTQLPATIPIHFDLKGNADGWGSKATILVLPGIAIFIYLLMTLLARSRQNFNYPVRITPENANRQYRLARHLLAVIKVAIVWGFLGLTWLILQAAGSQDPQLGAWPVIAFVGLIFAVIGGYLVMAFKK